MANSFRYSAVESHGVAHAARSPRTARVKLPVRSAVGRTTAHSMSTKKGESATSAANAAERAAPSAVSHAAETAASIAARCAMARAARSARSIITQRSIIISQHESSGDIISQSVVPHNNSSLN